MQDIDKEPAATAESAASDSRAAPETMPSLEELLKAAELKAEEHHDTTTELALTGLSVLLGLLGIGIGYAIFNKDPLKKMPVLLENKYYVDEAYEATIINPIENTSRSFLWKIVDVKLIDGFVNGVANAFAALAGVLRTTQTGFARSYAAVILMGAIIVIGYFALR